MNPAQRAIADEERTHGSSEPALAWIRGRVDSIGTSEPSWLVLCAVPEGGANSPSSEAGVETRSGQRFLSRVEELPSGRGAPGAWIAGRFWVVVGGVDSARVSDWCSQLLEGLRTGDPGGTAERWCVGVALNTAGQDRSVEVLQRVAQEGCELAATAGGDRWMHTELYGLFQRQLERRQGRVSEVGSAGSGEIRELVVEVTPSPEASSAAAITKPEVGAPGVTVPDVPTEPAPSEAEVEAQRVLAEEAEALRGRLQNRDREMDVLQRRLAKVNALLDDAETELAVRRKAGPGEDGVESIYRDVQGLDPGDEQREKKGNLMRSIFDANLDLKQQREGASG